MLDLTKTKQLLTEAKNIGDHSAAQRPWRTHAIAATVRAAVRPGHHQALLDAGQRVVYPRFARLEAQFRRDLDDIFKNIDVYTVRRVRRIFRNAYTQAFQLAQLSATGSMSHALPPLKAEDKRWLETFLRKEFRLWDKFMADVRNASTTKMVPRPPINGVPQSDGEVVVPADPKKMDYDRRKEMYVQALTSMYNSSRVLATPPMTLYYWETTPSEHCEHCLYLQSKSPFIKENLPTVPKSGDTKCISNCNCHLRIKHVGVTEYLRVKAKAPSRETLLRGMRGL